MNAMLLKTMCWLFGGTFLLAATTRLDVDPGCTAFWYQLSDSDPVVVYCQAANCSSGFCSPSWSVSGSNIEMVCSCPGMQYPKCRAIMVWPGSTEGDVPQDGSGNYLDPASWRCLETSVCIGAGGTNCDPESGPDPDQPIGDDTPCECR